MRQAPHEMQLTSWIRFSIAALGTRYSSPGGTGCLFSSHGRTARFFSQNGAMSQARSRMTGIDGGASTVTVPSRAYSASLLLHAKRAWPFTHIAHEPQIALRQAQRTTRLSS